MSALELIVVILLPDQVVIHCLVARCLELLNASRLVATGLLLIKVTLDVSLDVGVLVFVYLLDGGVVFILTGIKVRSQTAVEL